MRAAGITLAEAPVERTTANREWGYRFGVDGVAKQSEARELLGGMSIRTLERRCADGLIRDGKDGKRVVYCRRSVMDYLASLER